MWQRVCLAIGLVVMSGAAAGAADKEGRFRIEGLGALSCDRYTEIRKKNDGAYEVVVSWMNGYLTAVNELSPDTFDVLPWQRPELIGFMVDRFCEANKQVNLVGALGLLVKSSMRDRIKSLPEVVTIGEGEAKIEMYKEVVRDIQERLIKGGHLKGKADGAFGPGTRAALESFQKASRIDVTGMPDQRTLLLLYYADGERPQGAAQPRQPAPAPAAAPAGQPKLDLRVNPR